MCHQGLWLIYEENSETSPNSITFQLHPDIPQAPCTHFPVSLAGHVTTSVLVITSCGQTPKFLHV